MTVLSIIKERRSIRRFRPDPIPAELIKELKEALSWAPSAGNLQARKFYFIFNQDIKNQLACTYKGTRWFVTEAPLVIIGCADEEKIKKYGQRGRSLFVINDVSLSIQNAMLVASEHKLGTCWVGSFDEGKIKKILKMPKHFRPIVILPVGYPKESPEGKARAKDLIEEVR